jgi:hypothetical protein
MINKHIEILKDLRSDIPDIGLGTKDRYSLSFAIRVLERLENKDKVLEDFCTNCACGCYKTGCGFKDLADTLLKEITKD